MNKIYVALVLLSFAQPDSLLAAGVTSGWVVGWGSDFAGESTGVPTLGSSTGAVALVNQPMKDIVAVAAGASHGLALTAAGAVAGWGFNYCAQATGSKSSFPYNASEMVTVDGKALAETTAIAAAGNRSAALRRGTVITWGDGQEAAPGRLSNIVAVSAGRSYILALKQDGAVVSLGGARQLCLRT